MTKDFCYLAQGRASNLKKYITQVPDDADLVLLSYDEEINYDGDFVSYFFPRSTWAEGRNYLIENVSRCYRFYIFLDDDVLIENGGFQDFQEKLIKYRPRSAVPLVNQIKDTFRFLPSALLQETIVFDQLMQAFRHDVLFGGDRCMRYDAKFDYLSWWYCCEINQLELVVFYGPVVQFNDIHVINANNQVKTGNQIGSIYKLSDQKIDFFLIYRYLLSKYKNKGLMFLMVYLRCLGRFFPYGPDLRACFGQNYHDRYKNETKGKRFVRTVWALYKLFVRAPLRILGVTPFKKIN